MLAVNAPELVRSASHVDKEAESLAKAHKAKGGENAEPVRCIDFLAERVF